MGRQKFGDLVFVKMEIGFVEKEKAQTYLNSKNNVFEEKFNLPDGTEVVCYCERAIYEIEVEQ